MKMYLYSFFQDKYSIRFISAFMIFLAGILFLTTSCEDSFNSERGEFTPPDGKELWMDINLSIPKADLPRPLRMLTDNVENKIEEIKLLVFEKSSQEYSYTYSAEINGLQETADEKTQFKAKLNATDKDVVFLLIANAGDAFDLYSPAPGTSLDIVKQALVSSFSPDGLTSIPMYGEADIKGGLSTGGIVLSVKMVRALARVDIAKELEPTSHAFRMQEVYIYRANDQIQIAPDSPNMDEMTAIAPSVPASSQLIEENPLYLASEEEDPLQIGALYIPESNPSTQTSRMTSVVVGGYYGEDSRLSYYRIDFNPIAEGHLYGQVLRNHRYLFKIKYVSREGAPSPEEALNQSPGGITVEVLPWEDYTSEMWFEGEHYIGVSTRSVLLGSSAGSMRTVYVQSSLPFSIKWPGGSEEASEDGQSVSDYSFDASLHKDNNGEQNDLWQIHIRSLSDGGGQTGTLSILTDRWVIDIEVTQDYEETFADRIIHVLTVTEVGDLGTTAEPGGASARAMRAVLDENFSPYGTIKVAGFAFTRVPNDASYANATAARNVELMRKLIWSQDIIYFPNNVTVSDAVADMLLEWVAGRPNRVLMVGTDSNSTNAALRNRLTDDGTWNFSNVGTITSRFKRADYSVEADVFFNGPFGEVATDAAFNKADNTAGYNYTYPRDRVTPLIVGDRSGYTDYMFFGVNKKSRIVYHGDAQLFQGGQMSNIRGEVNNDLDRLMANVWAWMVEQVLYGTPESKTIKHMYK